LGKTHVDFWLIYVHARARTRVCTHTPPHTHTEREREREIIQLLKMGLHTKKLWTLVTTPFLRISRCASEFRTF
jgi:hypothetical protein